MKQEIPLFSICRARSTATTPVTSTQPRMATRPSLASIAAATFPGYALVMRRASSGLRTTVVPRMIRDAPAPRYREAISKLRTPPPTCTGTSTVATIRRMMSNLTGFPRNAPSRATTCSLVAPAPANRRATSSGESAKTVESSALPWRSRTALPPWMSIAGITWNAMGSPSCRFAAQTAEVAEKREPRGLALFGMELDRQQVSPSHARGELHAVGRLAGDDGGIVRPHVIGVDEVEIGTRRETAEHRVVHRELDSVPPHVGDLQDGPPTRLPGGGHPGGEADHVPPQEPDPLVPPEFLAFGKQHLQAQADAEERPSVEKHLLEKGEQLLAREVPHAVAEGP